LKLTRPSDAGKKQMGFEHAVISFLNRWVVVVLPISILLLRLLFFRLAGNFEEMHRNLFALPQDLVFVAISFILAGVSRSIPGYAKHYVSDTAADLAALLQIVIMVGFAWFLSKTDKMVNTFHQNLTVGWRQIEREKRKENFSWSTASATVRSKLGLCALYVICIGIMMLVELCVGAGCVVYSLKAIE
jgi:hypothetical protein